MRERPSRSWRGWVGVLLMAAVACGPPDSNAAPEAATEEMPPETDVVRTADPARRGLSEADFPRIQELAPGVYSYEQLRSAGDERFTTVSLFVVTDEGVLVADGQGSVAETERLVAQIATVTDQPITHVVVCSDHGDHTAGNSAFPEGATFWSHPTSLANLRTSAANRADDAPPVILPTEMVADRAVLELGGRTVELLFLGRAHAGGDLAVYLPAEKILFMSEAYLNRIFPAMRSAYPSEWVAMIERAQELDVDIYVPGHGFVEAPGILEEELETFRQAVLAVIAEATRHHEAGHSADEAVAQAEFGDLESWSLRSGQAERAVRRVYMELDGELPPGP